MTVIRDDIHHLATPDGEGESGIPISGMFLRFSFVYMIAHGADQFVNIVQQVRNCTVIFRVSPSQKKKKKKRHNFEMSGQTP